MSAKPRDLLKTRAQRIGEVFTIVALKGGQANGQLVAFGGVLKGGVASAPKLLIADLTAVIGGAIVDRASAETTLTTALNTSSGQFRKALVEMDNAGAITVTPGAISTVDQASAVKPAPTSASKVVLGWLEIPASFTGGTTTLTDAMCKTEAYWAA